MFISLTPMFGYPFVTGLVVSKTIGKMAIYKIVGKGENAG